MSAPRDGSLGAMSVHSIRIIGDPVLVERADDVHDIDGKLVRLADEMIETMYDAPGLGLAAPQIGVRKRLFVYDCGDEGADVVVNPFIAESDGEWTYTEGCLSIPGLYFDIVRPKTVLLKGLDLDGNEVEIEADEIEARCFQHEMDHLDGVLLVEHLDDEQRREAKAALRELRLRSADVASVAAPSLGLSLP